LTRICSNFDPERTYTHILKAGEDSRLAASTSCPLCKFSALSR
jgi:hypothetical protein